MEKEKELNEFGDLIYNVLWAQKPKQFIKRLHKRGIYKNISNQIKKNRNER